MRTTLDIQQQAIVQRMGLALRSARFKAEQTQDELAVRIGVTRWTVAAMENGNPKVSIASWIKVSAILGLLDSWQEVLHEPEDPFARYDREQAEKDIVKKTRIRIRKKNASIIG